MTDNKIDDSFTYTQFQVNNYHFWRADRTAHGGDIAAYVLSDLPCDRKRKLEFNIYYIYHHTILPILLHGCEIWGYFNPLSNRLRRQSNFSMDKIYNRLQSEVLHVQFCKYVLGCGKKSSNFAALSELGRLPTHFNIVKAMLIFWHRLQNLDNQFPILKDAFKTSIELHIDKLLSWYG